MLKRSRLVEKRMIILRQFHAGVKIAFLIENMTV